MWNKEVYLAEKVHDKSLWKNGTEVTFDSRSIRKH
jgi:hypothetical protein